MKIKLNKKEFNCHSNGNHIKIAINNFNKEDMFFFNHWIEKTKRESKKDYVTNIQYENGLEKGTLVNCFPLVPNHGWLVICFDRRLLGPSGIINYFDYKYDDNPKCNNCGTKTIFHANIENARSYICPACGNVKLEQTKEKEMKKFKVTQIKSDATGEVYFTEEPYILANYSIHQIQRLSDDQLFTVGDKVKCLYGNIISKFSVNEHADEGIYIHFDNCVTISPVCLKNLILEQPVKDKSICQVCKTKMIGHSIGLGHIQYHCPKCGRMSYKMPKEDKPPIGLKPKFLYEQRFLEVCSFISRYYNSGQQIPIEWINEYNQLVINVGNNKQNKV